MSIYFRNDMVKDLYVGLTPVSKGYVGTHLFYNGDNTIIDITYEKYILNTRFNTLYNTEEKPVKSAILKGSTGYRDIDTGDILDTFDETKNIELVSVKMPVLKTTGKNLLEYIEWEIDKRLLANGAVGEYIGTNVSNYINVSNLDVITFSGFSKGSHCLYDKDKNIIGERVLSSNMTIDVGGADYIRVSIVNTKDYSNPQMEAGSVATSYEPSKSNILTANEPVELRGIGEVKDELNLETGELTQRIGETVLDGSQSVIGEGYIRLDNAISDWTGKDKYLLSDKLPTAFYIGSENLTTPTLALHGTLLYVRGSNSNEEITEYFRNNPTTVQYRLAKESIKTVDLSIVDQDGNNAELSTFNDITHVTLSSEGLIPEAELEVATKNEEDLEDSSVYTIHTLSEEFNTLYNTEEKPVKSAILKGNTLTNLSQSNGEITLTPNSVNFVIDGSTMIKSNTTYTVSFNCLSLPSTNFIEFRQAFDNTALKMENISVVQGHNKFKVTTVNNKVNRFRLKNDTTSETDFVFNNIMIIEGDYTNIDIPYFEGMQSVKMPVLTTINGSAKILTDTYLTKTGELSPHHNSNKAIEDYILIPPMDVIVSNVSWLFICFYDENKNFISNSDGNNLNKFELNDTTIPDNAKYFRFHYHSASLPLIRFVNGTDYIKATIGGEPFKTNILTVNEEVELCGIGDVKDELNLSTGELTQRVGEVVLDGNEDWGIASTKEKTQVYYILNSDTEFVNFKKNSLIMCDKLKVTSGVDDELITLSTNLYMALSKSKASTVAELKTYLSQNPIIVQYQLATESIKTVDLSTIDQDGNDTKLSTFDDLTHVTLSSEGLIPEAELEVAEKVTEVAASMLSISREQEIINTTTNEQSENVDATMLATTEIYEGLL